MTAGRCDYASVSRSTPGRISGANVALVRASFGHTCVAKNLAEGVNLKTIIVP
jgi:hypothetical protein